MICFILFPQLTLAESMTVPSGLEIDEIEATIDPIMHEYIGEDKDIPGAAFAIVKNNQIIFEKGYGMSDIENRTKVDPEETIFEAASISKVYTWSAVMQLVESGEMRLNEDIFTYLPDHYFDRKYTDKITMLDLMNHTAGFEDTTEFLLVTDPEKVISLESYLSRAYEQPKQIFRPGTVTAYSNYSTSLAGLIVERVSGMDFAEYMNTHVLERLDMSHATFTTDYSQLSKITDNKSKGYRKGRDTFTEVEWAYVNDAPAGGLQTTVHDMAHFMIAQLGSDIYQLFERKETLTEMHEQTSNFTKNAHGFWERSVNDFRVLEHGGNSTGFTTQMTLIPEENFGMVLLMNVSDEMSNIRIDLMEQLVGKTSEPTDINRSKNDEKVKGTYRIARGSYTNFLKLLPIISPGDVTVKEHSAGGITLQTATDSKPIHYVEIKDLVYERIEDIVTLTDQAGMHTNRVDFQVDEQGKVIKMTYGVVSDFLPVSVKDRIGVNIAVIIVSALTFFIFTLTSFIQWIKRKRKKIGRVKGFSVPTLLAGVGLLVIINIIVLFSRFIQDPFQELAPLQVHLWLNYLFPICFLVSSYFILKQWKKITPFQNSARVFLWSISLIFILFLAHFNFLTF